MKAKGSYRDNRGALYVDCVECQRGPNGVDKNNLCSAGWHHKRIGQGGCFLGKLLPGIKEPKPITVSVVHQPQPEQINFTCDFNNSGDSKKK